jgi:hypothetical protein
MFAHRIQPFQEHLKQLKLQLFLRLYANSYTKELLDSICDEMQVHDIKNSFINDIIRISGSTFQNINELHLACGKIIGTMKTEYKRMIKSDNQIGHI